MKKTVFVIDDSITSLSMAAEALWSEYTVLTMPSGLRAFELLEKVKPDIILLDIEMPEMDGFEVLKRLKQNPAWQDIPIIFLTAKKDNKTEILALELGVSDFISKPFNPAVLLNRIKHHVDISVIVKERTAALNKAKQDIVFVLADVVENRDESTGEHLTRTSYLVNSLIKQLVLQNVYHDRISTWDIGMISECSILHDVGKINTPDRILQKPGKLTNEEYEIMKTHTTAGDQIINKIIARGGENAFLNHARIFALYHHERWDGTGYPFGLAGEDIPLQGRIMAIVDVYDALTSRRVYKDAMSKEEAINVLIENRGTHFDPVLVDVFLEIISSSEG